MTTKRRRFPKGIQLDPDTSAITEEGEVRYNDTSKKVEYQDDSATREVVSEDGTQTLENKTIDATAATGNNTISADASDIEYDNGASGLTATDTQAALDELKTITDNQNEASEISYDNSTSGLSATNVQDAIDEVEGRVDTIESATYVNSFEGRTGVVTAQSGDYDADQVTYDNSTSGLTATDVQGAVDEVEGRVDTIESATYVNSFNSRTGAVLPAASDYDADQVDYDNATSGLTATDVQAAIDEVDGDLDVHIADTTAHGTTGDVVGTSDSQVLTNKDIDGGTASNTSRVTIPKDTRANLDALTRKEATIVYATDEQQALVDDGTQLVPLGSSEGGLINFDPLGSFETAQTSDYSTSGGTLSITDTPSEVGRGDKALKFISTVASESVQRDNLDVPLGYRRNQFLGFKFQASISEDWTVSLFDVTNSQDLMSETISGSGDYKPFEFIVGLPTNTTQVYWKFESTAADTLLVDDIVITPDVTQLSKTQLSQDIRSTDGTTGADLLTRTTLEFDLSDLTSTGDDILTVSNVSSYTRFTANVDCVVDVTIHTKMTSAAEQYSFRVNDSQVARSGGAYGANTQNDGTVSLKIKAGDYINILATGSGVPNDAGALSLNVTAYADSDSLITSTTNFAPTRYTSSDSASITNGSSVFLDFPTLDHDDDSLVTGSGNGNDATYTNTFRYIAPRAGYITVTAGVLSNSGVTPSLGGTADLGIMIDGVRVSDRRYETMSSDNTSFALDMQITSTFYIQEGEAISIRLSNDLGDTIALDQNDARNYAEFTYTDRQYTVNAALPATAYLKDLKPSGTPGGGAVSGSFNTRTLNTLEGTTTFITLSSNQFTLQPGKYRIEGTVPGFRINGHKARIQNITDGVTEIVGTTESCNSSDLSQTRSFVSGEIIITSSKTFELQHRVSTTRATNGLGDNISYGVDELYSQITVTKLR